MLRQQILLGKKEALAGSVREAVEHRIEGLKAQIGHTEEIFIGIGDPDTEPGAGAMVGALLAAKAILDALSDEVVHFIKKNFPPKKLMPRITAG